MTKLTTLSCVACSGDSPLATAEEIDTLRLQVPEWSILNSEGIGKLERVFEFSNFIQALEFTNDVGNLAEQENHHPAILTEWGRVTVTWWTHKIGGLHHNDFVAAAKTDKLLT
ncbi:MAG: 4a-hydroxytetrahydrobiopterin dehydratase [Anaerolineaceae bacterium]|nr:4a-hydroxytetrahydrobiopterin dehydratase [Anaerolineaceae bacterium]HCU81264.1 4a-hydroxytetrahydrobiopterin dehydratase [Chloroflexota bacterium]